MVIRCGWRVIAAALVDIPHPRAPVRLYMTPAAQEMSEWLSDARRLGLPNHPWLDCLALVRDPHIYRRMALIRSKPRRMTTSLASR
jgi:hypothetical protein